MEKKGPFFSDDFVGKSVLSNFTERYVKKQIGKTVFPKKNIHNVQPNTHSKNNNCDFATKFVEFFLSELSSIYLCGAPALRPEDGTASLDVLVPLGTGAAR